MTRRACIVAVFLLFGAGLTAWAVHTTFSSSHDGAEEPNVLSTESRQGTQALLTQLCREIEPVLARSRGLLLGQRADGEPTCVTRDLTGDRVILQASPTGGPGLRVVALYGVSPDTPLALYRWSQEELRSFLQGERQANALVLANVEELAAVARELAVRLRSGSCRSVEIVANEPVDSPAWPAECLHRLRAALRAGDSSLSRTWAEELAAATFTLADLHRWLNVLLDCHLTSLDFQARCRTAFEWTDSVGGSQSLEQDSCLPAAGQMVAWAANFLEVERQAEGVFAPVPAAAALVESQAITGTPAARSMPPELREAFLSLRGHLSPPLQAVWDQAAAAPFERSYLANMLFRAVATDSLEAVGLVLERFSQCHATATPAELMDVLFCRAGLYSSGFPWSDRYDPRILDTAGAITGRRDLAALRAHRLVNTLLKGWENYVGGVTTLARCLDAGKFDCVRGTDLVGALYRGAGQSGYFLVRLNCGTVGHSVGAVPVEADGRRHLLILDCLDSRTPNRTWPSAFFHGLTWPEGYPGTRGLLFSAELHARGLDGCLFAEGYVVRGEHAGQWMRAALPYLPDRPADCARIFNGPYPPSP